MSCGISCRRVSGPELLWLWHTPAAVAMIQPLAWELPYAVGVALKSNPPQKKNVMDIMHINCCFPWQGQSYY